MFSYLDTQLKRLGGPNFAQLPINCPHIGVHDNLRDGMHQTVVHEGIASYFPKQHRRRPSACRLGEAGSVCERSSGGRRREGTGQPGILRRSLLAGDPVLVDLTNVERDHVVEAFTFEIGKCTEQAIRGRTLANLANVDGELCACVAAGLGLRAPLGKPAIVVPSPALSQITGKPGPIAGRVVGVVAGPDSGLAGIASAARHW